MTITLDGYTAIDVYRAIGFPLNNDGTFNVPDIDEELYEGVEFLAPVGLDFSLGEPRSIPVVAQGQVQTTFNLPSTDAKTAVLRAAYEKMSTDVALTDTLVDTIGAMKAMGIDSNKAGQEKLMAFMISQLQSHDEDGNSIWANVLLNRTRIKPNRPSFTSDAMAKEYLMTLSRSTKRMWGETYSEVTHGREEDIGDVILSQDKLNIGAWLGDGVITEFNLPVDKPAVTSARAKVWDVTTGAARAGAWDAPNDSASFTPTVMPTAGAVLFVTYEYE
jgi:hypothetical protein